MGEKLLDLRSWYDLRSVSFDNPEKASMVANGLIADRLIARLPKQGSRFLDIGAHIGSIFSAVHRHDNSVQITAIEAEADKAKHLRTAFPYCEVLNFAVGEEDGTATFNIMKSSGYNSLVSGAGGEVVAQQTVDLRRLDGLFPETTFDTIKMDIEGAELGAMRGGQDLLQRSRPTIMFESAKTEENSLGYSSAKLFDWFSSEDFVVLAPNRVAHDAPALSKDAFLDAHAYPMLTHNFFAVAAERRHEIRDRARDILGIRVPS